jgi:uncharacterized protein YneF (UPF0154 family)
MEDGTFWLAVLAVAVAIQSIIWVGLAIGLFVAYRRASTALDQLQRQTVSPLVAHAHAALDKVEDSAARLRAAEDTVRHFVTDTGQKASRAASAARQAIWPLIGLGRGALAAYQALQHRRHSGLPAPSRPTGLSGVRERQMP